MYLKIDQPVTKIGLISDTHGILRPEAVRYLHGVDYILHAGDIGKPVILRELEKIAPTVAVLGNTVMVSRT
jgi:predicted phosphodiesterase